MAETFRDAAGLNVHTGANVYASQIPKLETDLHDMGIVHVRDNNPKGPALLPDFKVQVVIDTLDPVVAAQRVTTAITAGATSIECVNEPVDAIAAQKVNAAIVAAAAGKVPVVMSALKQPPNLALAAQLGPQPGTHAGAVHLYPDLTPWPTAQARVLALLSKTAPFLPWMVTETGAFPPGDYSYLGGTPIDAQVWAARIIPDLIGWLALGARRVYYYQAWDQPALAATREGHFGMIGTAAGDALKAFLAAYGDLDRNVGALTLAGQLRTQQAATTAATKQFTAAVMAALQRLDPGALA